MVLPPIAQRIDGKFMGIARSTNLDIADVLAQVIEPVRNRPACCERRPVMVIDRDGRLSVGVASSIQRAYPLFFLVSMLITGSPVD